MAFSAVYAASKAFVTSFTHALTEELRGTGVQTLAVLPGSRGPSSMNGRRRSPAIFLRLPGWNRKMSHASHSNT